MARRRMLSDDVIGQERFLEMPGESQALYAHINNAGDDDGFVQPMGILRKTIGKIDSLKVLFLKGFLIPFPDKWAVIRDWNINNTISPSRRSRKERRPEYRLLQCVDGRYYLKTKSDLNFTAWLNDEYKNDDVLHTNCIQLVAQETKKEINFGSENQNLEKEEEKNAEDSENTKKIIQESRLLLGLDKRIEPQG